MATTTPATRPVCQIGVVDDCACARVGPGLASEIQHCYRDWAYSCVAQQCRCALLVGTSDGDAFPHLAARDAIASIALGGIPGGFRLAVVAENAAMIMVYDAVVVTARRHGIDARRFQDEKEAVQWLGGGP